MKIYASTTKSSKYRMTISNDNIAYLSWRVFAGSSTSCGSAYDCRRLHRSDDVTCREITTESTFTKVEQIPKTKYILRSSELLCIPSPLNQCYFQCQAQLLIRKSAY
jgi:hypothetical protein